MPVIQFIIQIPIKTLRLLFRLAVAVMRILLSVLAFLMPRSIDKSKFKTDNYAKEAWVKSGK